MEMRALAVKREVDRVKAKYGTDDPLEICDAMGIRVSEKPMGTHAESCKGFFLVNARCKKAIINRDLSEEDKRIILPHELGHGVLHVPQGILAFHELSLLDETDTLEKDANMFAAELIINNDELMDLIRSDYDFFQIARMLSVPPEFLDFKLRLMKQEGYDVIPPYLARSDFLKKDLSKPRF